MAKIQIICITTLLFALATLHEIPSTDGRLGISPKSFVRFQKKALDYNSPSVKHSEITDTDDAEFEGGSTPGPSHGIGHQSIAPLESENNAEQKTLGNNSPSVDHSITENKTHVKYGGGKTLCHNPNVIHEHFAGNIDGAQPAGGTTPCHRPVVGLNTFEGDGEHGFQPTAQGNVSDALPEKTSPGHSPGIGHKAFAGP